MGAAVSGKPSIPPPQNTTKNTVQTLSLPPSQYREEIDKVREELTQFQHKIDELLKELKEDEDKTNRCMLNKTLTNDEGCLINTKIKERRKALEELKKEMNELRPGGSNKSSKKKQIKTIKEKQIK